MAKLVLSGRSRLIGSAGLIGLDLLINYTGSSNQTNQTNLLDEINQIRA